MILDIDINMSSLDRILKQHGQVSTMDMADAWLFENCVETKFRIVAINSVRDQILFIHGIEGKIYRDLVFDIKLPFSTGKDKVDSIQIESYGDFIYFNFSGITLMAIPVPYIVALLLGRPVASFSNAKEERFGKEISQSIDVSEEGGGEAIPAIVKVAANHFSLKNTAIRILSYPIVSDTEFPVSLGIST